MLLNAADVVTAAERCQAIDKETGRIPINFLLSRSNDLGDHVKNQLQQLAAQSPSISILPDPSSHDHHMTAAPAAPADDAVMTDVTIAPSHPQPRLHPMHDHDSAVESDDEPPLAHYTHYDPHNHSHRSLEQSTRDEEEEEALKDIDLESQRSDRKLLRRTMRKTHRDQTLTRKAIRKHVGAKKVPCDLSLLPKDSSSTINTVSGSSCMQSSSHGSQTNTPRRRWKDWEDDLLMRVVAEHGPTRWNSLARHFPGRNGRQVRLRWMNHLQPSLDKRPWRPEEDAVLLEAHKDLGNKWAMIAIRLGGRTDNSVKNRYKSIVRRAAREAKARKQGHHD